MTDSRDRQLQVPAPPITAAVTLTAAPALGPAPRQTEVGRESSPHRTASPEASELFRGFQKVPPPASGVALGLRRRTKSPLPRVGFCQRNNGNGFRVHPVFFRGASSLSRTFCSGLVCRPVPVLLPRLGHRHLFVPSRGYMLLPGTFSPRCSSSWLLGSSNPARACLLLRGRGHAQCLIQALTRTHQNPPTRFLNLPSCL